MINVKRLDRIQRILEVLEEQGNASTIFLANSFGVSESSIRRDVTHMVSTGRYGNLKRVYGGVLLENSAEGHEYMFELKQALNRELKIALAREARRFIDNEDHIILDSGTTCLCLAQQLSDKERLRVITLDIKIAEELGRRPNIECNIVGGVIRPGYYTVGGIKALDSLESYSPGKVFMSADAIDFEHGITNASEFEVGVKQRLIQKASHVYLLADFTKFNTHTLYRVAPTTSVQTIITNRQLDPQLADAIRAKGIELVLA